MRNIFFLFFSISIIACQSEKKDDNLLDAEKLVNNPIEPQGKVSGDTSLLPKIHFNETEFDFGDKIQEGQVVTHLFKFKNYGKSPLIISKAESTCGCTISDFSRDPIAPEKEGSIKVSYNSQNRPGSFQKTIRVGANTVPNEIKLTIIGDVIEQKN